MNTPSKYLKDDLRDLTTLAQSLAKRYRNSQEYDDLVQEGILVALEHPEEPLWEIVPKMRRAMSAYFTGFKSPVTIPDSGATRSLLSAIMRDTVGDTATHTEGALLAALQGLSEPIEANTLRTYESSEDIHGEDEMLTKVLECLTLYLTKEESYVLREYYLNEKNMGDIAEDMDVHVNTVAARRDSGIYKLNKMLC